MLLLFVVTFDGAGGLKELLNFDACMCVSDSRCHLTECTCKSVKMGYVGPARAFQPPDRAVFLEKSSGRPSGPVPV